MSDGEAEYVLGAHDEEIERLGLQHSVWKPIVEAAWRAAGFSAGQVIMDIGAGPGFAALDLGRVAGPAGRVLAVDRSDRFLSHLRSAASAAQLHNIETERRDLNAEGLPTTQVDGAWCRWVLAFLRHPRRIVEQIAQSVRPGGTFVSHEYFSYDTWRLMPPSAALDEFVQVVQAGWRSEGGEPNVGLEIPGWLTDAGFEIISARPLVFVLTRDDPMWQWPASFVRVGALRYAELGHLTPDRAREIIADLDRRESAPGARMITPGVLEVIARRR